eukprot:scaffold13422_cov86-Isochrysis_galbana.AAC.1
MSAAHRATDGLRPVEVKSRRAGRDRRLRSFSSTGRREATTSPKNLRRCARSRSREPGGE